MKKQLPFLLALGIIVVAAIAAGIVLHYQIGQPLQNNVAPTSTSTPSGSTTASSSAITYTNSTYGFTFSLPADWQGYSIVTSTWNGDGDEACPAAGCPTVTGPEISIRNPNWTKASPWQDIPIMVFTPSEWSEVASGTLAVGAAPIPPTKLGANTSYVFALPARYNYAYPNGWQEVQSIMQGNPLYAFDGNQ